MNTRKGIVERTDNKHAWILAKREIACGDCTPGGCCTAADGRNSILVKAINEVGAKPGDKVSFYLKQGIKLKWMAILFAAPVIGAILGAWAGSATASAFGTDPDGTMVAVTLVGLAAGFALVWLLANSSHSANELTPVIFGREKKRI